VTQSVKESRRAATANRVDASSDLRFIVGIK
jgi:hypothetical protein